MASKTHVRAARKRRRKRCGKMSRSLFYNIERLEERNLFSVNPLVSPAWFEDFCNPLEARHVNPVTLTTDESGAPVTKYGTKDDSVVTLTEVGQYDWIVRLDPQMLGENSSPTDAAALMDSGDGGVQFQVQAGLGLVGQVLVRSYDATIEAVGAWLGSNDAVASFELDVMRQFQVIPDDDSVGQLWGMNNTGQTGGTIDADIDAAEAWDVTMGSSEIVVGIIDTGIDYTHPDLAANIWTNPGEIAGNGIDDDGNGFIDDIHGYDFVSNDGDPMDDNRHGTHVAGTIGGVGNNDIGVAGVNWTTSLMGLKFLSASGSGYTSNAVRAVNYATMMRTLYDVDIRVTNNSWGGGGYSDALADAIQVGGQAGILFVAAAGNSGSDNEVSPHYPSSYEMDAVISVAATDHNDDLASFSCYGATSVDLAAPGVSIYSTVPGGGYASLSGTSMATPHVTGVAALAWSIAPDATITEIRNVILAGVDPVASLDSLMVTGGRLNALATLEQLGLHVSGSSPARQSILSGQPVDFTIDLSAPFDPASIDASDLTVNGVAADSFTLVDSDSITFHYNTSPVVAEGTQQMAIAAGVISNTDGSELIKVWQSTFYRDELTMAVLATDPLDGAVLTAAPASITLDFNEAVDAGSIGTDDLVLSAGVITAAEIVDADTVRYSVDQVREEGPFTFTLAGGAVNDIHGTPGPEYTGSYVVDHPNLVYCTAADTPIEIIDEGTIESTIIVPQQVPASVIVDVDVELDITHTWDDDLSVYLIAPDGTEIELFSGVGWSGENFEGTILDDEAAVGIADGEAPFHGRFRPESPLSVLDGIDPTGTWTLRVTDEVWFDTGFLNDWTLRLFVDQPPVARWNFNEGAGVSVADTSNNLSDHTGVLRGDAHWNPYGIGGAISFDGSGDWVETPSSGDLNRGVVSQRTVSGWFFAPDTMISGRKQVIYEEGGDSRGLSIYLDQGRLYVGGWNSPTVESGWAGTFLSTDQIESGRWHHVALTLDGGASVTDGALRGYLDGVEFGQGAGSQLWSHGDPVGIGQVAVATRFHDFATYGGHGFAGMLDEIRVYDRALTATTIAELANEHLAAPQHLTVAITQDSIWENDAPITSSVVRDGDLSESLTVSLTSSNPGRLSVPAFVTILAGETTATFQMTAQDNSTPDGTARVAVFADAPNCEGGVDFISVWDDELPEDSLVAYWGFDEGAGTVAVDTSPHGNTNSAYLVGNTSWSPMGLVSSLEFDGNGDYLAVPDSSDLNMTWVPQRTISLWFAVDDASVSSRKQVLLEEGGIDRGLNIYLDNGRLYVGAWNVPATESGWSGTYLSTDQIQSGQWHHVVLVLNGGTGVGANGLRGYLDGTQFGSGAGSQLWSHGDDMGIGQVAQYTRFHSGVESAQNGFAGLIDEVRVYNRVLADNEIQVLAAQPLSFSSALSVALSEDSTSEGGNTVQGTVTRDGDLTNALIVTLSSSDTSEATVPSTATILAGQTTATFTVTAQDDAVSDGTQTAIITATADGYRDGQTSLQVLDDEVTDAGLVAYWAFDEGSGSTAADTSPYGHDNSGTLSGDTAWVPQGLNQALQFDGDGDLVAIPDSTDLNLTVVTQRTYSLWFNVDDASIGSRRQVILEEGGSTRGMNIYVEAGQLFVGAWNSPTTESGWSGTFLVTDQIQSGQWHHVALVLDAGSTVQANSLRGYLDGVLFGSGVGSQVWSHGDDMGIGQVVAYTKYHTGEASTAQNGFAGCIDEVRAYNRALSAGEIQVLSSQPMGTTDRLTVSIAAAEIAEESGSTTATVTRSGDTSASLLVTLTSSDTSEATTQSTVTLAAGQASAAVTINSVDDTVRDGTQSTTITASAVDMIAGSDVLLVTDNEQLLVHGVVSNVTNAWTTVTLPQNYLSMVVVATPNYTESSVPLVTRIRNAVGDSFELRVDRTDGLTDPVVGVNVHYVVAEEGIYTQSHDGAKMEAVKYTSTVTDASGNWVGEQRSYAQHYQGPVVLGQVQTYNDAGFSQFWSSGANPSDPADSNVLRVGKHVGEDADGTRSSETVGYLVLDAGVRNVDGLTFAANVGAATIQGIEDGPPFEYAINGLSAASVAVANVSGMYGQQGGWAVLYGADPVSESRLRLAVDEDQAADAERRHVTENVSYLVFQDELLRLDAATNTGRDNTGRDNTGREDTGRDNTGREDTGREDTGREDTGREDTGREDTGREDTAPEPAEVTLDSVIALLDSALASWGDGLSPAPMCREWDIQIRDLPGTQLARVIDDDLWIDHNAAGYGWFMDDSPSDQDEFICAVGDREWSAYSEGPAAGKVDLLSVLAHELGHARGIGHEHHDLQDVMSETLPLGVRRLPNTESD